MGGAFRDRYGPWALVAGGSEGLGAEYVRQLAARGLDCLVVAERDEPLHEHCAQVAAEHGVEVRPAVVDLAAPDLLERIRPHWAGLELGLLVYNAAFSTVGEYAEQSLESKLGIVDLNCGGLVRLTHELGPLLAARRRGGIVIMSSMSALQGTPLVSTYAASKAFDLVLGEALWEELGARGVDVLTVCPGMTRTPGWEKTRADLSGALVPAPMEPADVVREALDSLGRRPVCVTGRSNRLGAFLFSRLLPRRLAVRLMGRVMRRQYRT